jgi:hypothetical protein
MELGKNTTVWQPQTVKGSVQQVGTAFVVDTSSTTNPNFIVDQSGNFIVTTPNVTLPPNTTTWAEATAS